MNIFYLCKFFECVCLYIYRERERDVNRRLIRSKGSEIRGDNDKGDERERERVAFYAVAKKLKANP